ncbi:MAG: hypothetical protein NTY74_14125 [Ignavibacteriae bacterium]|nr:hypothetical protein [Ignavibacteriota bacterium]
MSDYRSKLTINASKDKIILICRHIIKEQGYKVISDDGQLIRVKGSFGAFTNPVTIYIEIKDTTPDSTINFFGNNTGMGPIQNSHVKKSVENLITGIYNNLIAIKADKEKREVETALLKKKKEEEITFFNKLKSEGYLYGKVEVECSICESTTFCPRCGRTGKCTKCGGNGFLNGRECSRCYGRGVCDYCGGKGVCPTCRGKGKIVEEKWFKNEGENSVKVITPDLYNKFLNEAKMLQNKINNQKESGNINEELNEKRESNNLDDKWTKENLDVENYQNGDLIPQIQDSVEWKKLTTGAWCYYDNDSENGKTYGKLYNWYAVNDPRGLAPKGWHIPSDEEWTQLINAIGGSGVAGLKLKATMLWDKDSSIDKTDHKVTNEIGFSALPGGYRTYDGKFQSIGKNASFWTSLGEGNLSAWSWGFNSYFPNYVVRVNKVKGSGFSCRCIKDNVDTEIINNDLVNKKNESLNNESVTREFEEKVLSSYKYYNNRDKTIKYLRNACGLNHNDAIQWVDFIIKKYLI